MYKKIYRSLNATAFVIMILTAILTISACYTSFNARLKDEIKSETHLIADTLNTYGTNTGFLPVIQKNERRVTLISGDGTVILDSEKDTKNIENHFTRPEIAKARENGEGYSQRYSKTTGSQMYYYAVRLNDGSIIRLAMPAHNFTKILIKTAVPIILVLILVYMMGVIISVNLTKNIVEPINQIDINHIDYSNVYDELVPFLKRISGQNNEISRQMEKVKRQKIRLQTVSDNMNEGLVVLDSNKNVISANAGALKIFNAETGEISHKNIVYLTRSADISEKLDEAFSGKKCSLKYQTDSKAYHIFFSPVSENGNVSGVIMLMFDISGEYETAQIRREFTANVSHELRTPLTAILGYSQIINNDIAKAEDVKKFTAKIEKEAARLLTLIDDVIKLSRLDESNSDGEKTYISLIKIARDVIDTLEQKAQQRGIRISLNGNDTTIYANGSQITELVYNITDNAIKYNKENGKIDIIVSDGEIKIADTGIGIPEQYKERIFERFFRVDKSHSKKVNGTGLGLSIVKHIALENNAEITVESKEGEGTVFDVKFI